HVRPTCLGIVAREHFLVSIARAQNATPNSAMQRRHRGRVAAPPLMLPKQRPPPSGQAHISRPSFRQGLAKPRNDQILGMGEAKASIVSYTLGEWGGITCLNPIVDA